MKSLRFRSHLHHHLRSQPHSQFCAEKQVPESAQLYPQSGAKRMFAALSMLVGTAVLLSSCTTLEAQSSSTGGGTVVNRPTVATSSSASEAAIEVLNGADTAERQALINAINRDGQSAQFQGRADNAPQPVSAGNAEDVVELNYEQADLRLVLEELARALDISMVIDPTISRQISIRTAADRPLRRDDIWPLIRLLTRDAGVLVEQVGNVYNVRSIDGSLPEEIVTPDQLDASTSPRVLQVTPLTYISSDTAVQALEPMLQPGGGVTRLGNRNLLVISGTNYQLGRVNQLLTLLDADPFQNQGIRLYELSNANATEVAEELQEILMLIEGENPAYQVRGIERINTLLVTAPATRGFDEIGRWVGILDSANQEQVEQLFMYRVKNLVAEELAATLAEIFDQDDDEDNRTNNQQQQETTIATRPQLLFQGIAEEGRPAVVTQTTTNSAASANEAVSANLRVRIVADEATNSLLIRATARDYRQLLTTINQLDVVPLQVMVNAVIAQITLNDDTRFGVDWSRIAADANMSPISTNTQTTFTPELAGLMFTKGFLDGAARVEATLQAIASNNEVRLLARPSLTVSNNQEGEILIGAEVPINAGQTIGVGGSSTTNIQYRPTGIGLSITPQINTDGVVNLVISQNVSSLDSSVPGVQDNPVFNTQEITTTVVVRNGENIVLGGLIQTDEERLNTGVPGLNRLPVVGNLFSYQQRNEERKELFIVLRPEVINLNEQTGAQFPEILDRFELAAELFEENNLR